MGSKLRWPSITYHPSMEALFVIHSTIIKSPRGFLSSLFSTHVSEPQSREVHVSLSEMIISRLGLPLVAFSLQQSEADRKPLSPAG